MNPAEAAEEAVRLHLAIATSENRDVAASGRPIYDASQALLLAAIGVAYPDVSAEVVYDVWLDCNESIAHCAREAKAQADAFMREASEARGVTYVPNYDGHWRGAAWITTHPYGEQAHRSLSEAERWLAQRAPLDGPTP